MFASGGDVPAGTFPVAVAGLRSSAETWTTTRVRSSPERSSGVVSRQSQAPSSSSFFSASADSMVVQ